MKSVLPQLTVAFLAACILSTTGCKKDDDTKEPIPQDCKIIQLHTPGSNDITIEYDQSGRLLTVSDGNYIKSFTYSDNKAIITKSVAGNLMEKRTITTNGEGLATEVQIQHNAANSSWTNYKYFYDGTQVKIQATEDNMGNRDTTWYGWKEGDLTRIYTLADTTALTYYYDQTYRDGDFFKSNQYFMEGFEFVRNAHLVQNATNGSNVINFSYAYDVNDRIKSVTVVDPATKTTTYTWQCK